MAEIDGPQVPDRLARLRVDRDQPIARQVLLRMQAGGVTWQRGLLAVVGILVLSVVTGSLAILAQSGSASDHSSRQGVPALHPTTSTPASAARTTAPTALNTAVAAGPTDRRDCDAIRGTDYQSTGEQQFYEAACATPESPSGSVRGVATIPTEPLRPRATDEPTSPAEPTQPSFGAGDAIAAGSSWISDTSGYVADSQACTAIQIGSHWVVTCDVHLDGCSGTPECDARVSVCVFVDPIAVRASDQC